MSLVRNGRILVYPAEVLLDTDLLRQEVFRMVDISKIAQTILGGWPTPPTLAAGLACTPKVTPPFSVNIADGVIYQFEELDATAYGSLAADTTDLIYKQGINFEVVPIDNLNPPGTGGDSIAYLIEAKIFTADTESTTRQYYNPSNPPVPITMSANDVRTDTVAFQTKASSAAPSPTIPTPDAGYIGLWVVTVPNGASVITSGMISAYTPSSLITETLPEKMSYRKFQNSSPIFGNDTGTANAIVVTSDPPYTEVVEGTRLIFKAANDNTGATSINLSVLGTVAVVKANMGGRFALAGGEIISGNIYEVQYDGTQWQLLNPTLPTFYGMSLAQNPGQAISGDNLDNLLQWDNTPEFDNSYGIITYTDSSKLNVLKKGFYEVIAIYALQHTGGTVSGSFYIKVFLNGVEYKRFNQINFSDADEVCVGSVTLPMNANDYVQLVALNSTGTTFTGGGPKMSSFQIKYLGA